MNLFHIQTRRQQFSCILFFIAFTTFCALVGVVVLRRKVPCGPGFESQSVDISHAEGTESEGYKVDGIFYPPGKFWKRGNYTFGCPCLVKPCIRKCCPNNVTYTMKNSKGEPMCTDSDDSNFYEELRNYHFKGDKTVNDFSFVFGEVCPDRRRVLVANKSATLSEDGILDFYGEYTHSEYCIETVNAILKTFICSKVQIGRISYEINLLKLTVRAVCELIALLFLLATLFVYLWLHQYQDFHGKARICYVICLSVSFTVLIAVQEKWVRRPSVWCLVSAFTTQFSLLSYLFWLNIMCFDIWRKFRVDRNPRSTVKSNRKFLKHSVYGFGVPILFVLLSAVGQFCPWAQDYLINPKFNKDLCWFQDMDADKVYFFLPMTCTLFLNLMMVIATLYRIKRTDNMFNSSGIRRHVGKKEDNKTRFNTYLKLFVLVAVGWMIEVVGFMIEKGLAYYTVVDIFETLLGILTFLLFVVWDNKTMRELKKKWSKDVGTATLEMKTPTPVSWQNSGLKGQLPSLHFV